MNPSRFFMPYFNVNPMVTRNAFIMPRNVGLLNRITNTIHSFNWTKLLGGANKTLNFVNQTIPLIRQSKPMINNMKSILKIAKAFRSETNFHNSNISNISNSSDIKKTINYQINDAPTFFI